MPKFERTRAGRALAKATGVGLLKALSSLEFEATAAQRDLEGAFLHELPMLRYAPFGSPFQYGITQLEPARESLTIHFGAAARPQDFAEYVIPAVGQDGEVSGVPGLRLGPHSAGTRLYRPGMAGEIVLAGIFPDEIARLDSVKARREGPYAPHDWTSEEQSFIEEHPWSTSGTDIESAVLRRIILLCSTDAFSIHLWRSIDPTFTVDLVFDSLTRERAEALIRDFTSRHLTPRLVLDSFDFPVAPIADGGIVLSMPTTGETVELRLTIRSRQRRQARTKPISRPEGVGANPGRDCR